MSPWSDAPAFATVASPSDPVLILPRVIIMSSPRAPTQLIDPASLFRLKSKRKALPPNCSVISFLLDISFVMVCGPLGRAARSPSVLSSLEYSTAELTGVDVRVSPCSKHAAPVLPNWISAARSRSPANSTPHRRWRVLVGDSRSPRRQQLHVDLLV